MEHLHQVLETKVREWRNRGYPCEEFPAITEILEYQVEIEEAQDGALIDTLRKITDWRAMVDSVMIDPDYDGEVFDVALYDVPESKEDFVQGSYELPAPDTDGASTVAVKITDMLGEEVLVTETLGP